MKKVQYLLGLFVVVLIGATTVFVGLYMSSFRIPGPTTGGNNQFYPPLDYLPFAVMQGNMTSYNQLNAIVQSIDVDDEFEYFVVPSNTSINIGQFFSSGDDIYGQRIGFTGRVVARAQNEDGTFTIRVTNYHNRRLVARVTVGQLGHFNYGSEHDVLVTDTLQIRARVSFVDYLLVDSQPNSIRVDLTVIAQSLVGNSNLFLIVSDTVSIRWNIVVLPNVLYVSRQAFARVGGELVQGRVVNRLVRNSSGQYSVLPLTIGMVSALNVQVTNSLLSVGDIIGG